MSSDGSRTNKLKSKNLVSFSIKTAHSLSCSYGRSPLVNEYQEKLGNFHMNDQACNTI